MPRKDGVSISSPRSRQRRTVDDEAAKRFEAETEAKGAGVISLHAQPVDGPTSADEPLPVPSQQGEVSEVERRPGGKTGEALAHNRRGTLQRPHIRKDGVATKSTAFHLPIDLVKRLRVAAAISGQTQSSIAAAALHAWLKNNAAGQGH